MKLVGRTICLSSSAYRSSCGKKGRPSNTLVEFYIDSSNNDQTTRLINGVAVILGYVV